MQRAARTPRRRCRAGCANEHRDEHRRERQLDRRRQPRAGSAAATGCSCATTCRDRRARRPPGTRRTATSSGRSSPSACAQLRDVLGDAPSPSIACAGSPGTRWMSANTSVATPSRTGIGQQQAANEVAGASACDRPSQHALALLRPSRIGSGQSPAVAESEPPQHLREALARHAQLARGPRSRGRRPAPAPRARSGARTRAAPPRARACARPRRAELRPAALPAARARAADRAPPARPARSAARARCPASRSARARRRSRRQRRAAADPRRRVAPEVRDQRRDVRRALAQRRHARCGSRRAGYSRSARNRPAATSCSRSRLVAATSRTSTRRGRFSPTRRTSPSCSTRSSLACARGDSSPTSSRNSVPPIAPPRTARRARSTAPVNAPRAWPKSSASSSSSGSAAQLTCTEAAVAPRPEPVDGARDELLAAAALAENEHGERRPRGAQDRAGADRRFDGLVPSRSFQVTSGPGGGARSARPRRLAPAASAAAAHTRAAARPDRPRSQRTSGRRSRQGLAAEPDGRGALGGAALERTGAPPAMAWTAIVGSPPHVRPARTTMRVSGSVTTTTVAARTLTRAPRPAPGARPNRRAPTVSFRGADAGRPGPRRQGQFDENQPTVAAVQAAPTTQTNALRPYLGYSTIRDRGPFFTNNYNSLQVSLNHHSHGVAAGMAYTWSKDLTTQSQDRDVYSTYQYDFKLDYGPSSYNQPHTFTAKSSMIFRSSLISPGLWAELREGGRFPALHRCSPGRASRSLNPMIRGIRMVNTSESAP